MAEHTTKELRNFDEGLSSLEFRFNELFKEQIEKIQIYARRDEPLLLEEVLTMGFNNVRFRGTTGYEPADFSDEDLTAEVDFDYWEEDDDFYRTVCLKEIER